MGLRRAGCLAAHGKPAPHSEPRHQPGQLPQRNASPPPPPFPCHFLAPRVRAVTFWPLGRAGAVGREPRHAPEQDPRLEPGQLQDDVEPPVRPQHQKQHHQQQRQRPAASRAVARRRLTRPCAGRRRRSQNAESFQSFQHVRPPSSPAPPRRARAHRPPSCPPAARPAAARPVAAPLTPANGSQRRDQGHETVDKMHEVCRRAAAAPAGPPVTPLPSFGACAPGAGAGAGADDAARRTGG
jgi:hypothetical protein